MFIAAYWNARRESKDCCAIRISDALNRLSSIDSRLGSWFLKTGKDNANLSKVGYSPKELLEQLRTNNRDSDSSAITELGFSLGLWNGSESTPCTFTVTCGCYSEFIKNCVVLDFPQNGNIFSEDIIRMLLVEIILAFSPDTAFVTSDDFLENAGGEAPWNAGGWFNYSKSEGVEKIEKRGEFGKI